MERNTSLPAAMIFDMDGVLINSNPFHLAKWVDLLNEHKIPFVAEDLPKLLFGKRNDTAFRHFMGPDITPEESRRLSEDLEARFRRAFRPHARPLPGLAALIEECHRAGMPMAVASSAMVANIEFVVDALDFRRFFRQIVSGDHVSLPKPDPEIYLKAAELLRVVPRDCVAFEDSFVGIEAAHRAGMKCVGIASTFSVEELRVQTPAVLVVRGFEDLSLTRLRGLFNGQG
jgi:HAD superfamily hydrolase (TIGR01509 family)